ncbi:DUF4194 domain-containing protein [Micromonospora andamanensis]|uniref:DUF4194 domain-containing protein n=1 Tax=Micromonospora andamanensis TaxID=1287068 RepID=UPI00194DB62D|nr:DUF4194 domain-containing protein [Micromonospora andamanensis]GIJ40444.1 hypothetical protein Vwe01_37690 [Micromonospora andamanensis]
MSRTSRPAEPNLSIAVTHLMKGVVYRDAHPVPWLHLTQLQTQVRDYVAVMGLTVAIDEAEGYAFLRSRPDDSDLDGPAVPRLIPRRSLSFHVSLLLALLRKKLAEFDANNSDTRLVLTRQQVIDLLATFMPTTIGEARLVDQIDTHLNKVVELGFLRRLDDGEASYEVRRIIKAFVDGQWLADLDTRLAEYAAELSGTTAGPQ